MKSLSDRIEDNIASLERQQAVLLKALVVVGVISLLMMGLGTYNNIYFSSQMERLYNPRLPWCYIASWFIFICYFLVGALKMYFSFRIWKLKKEVLAAKRYVAYLHLHPIKKEKKVFINQDVLSSLEGKI